MSELRRLLDDDADELERALLLSARDEASPDGAHARTLSALGVAAPALAHGAGAGAAAAGGAAAGGGTALQGGVVVIVVKWLGIGLIAGALTGGGLVAVTHTRAASVAPARPPTAHAVVDRPRVLPHAVPAPAPPAPGTATALAAAPAPGPSASAAPAPDVSAELALLDRARRELASGDANGALGVLAEHDRRFHGGELGPEAQVLRVEALVAAGRRSEAARRARALLVAHPHSPYTTRLRTLLARATSRGVAAPAPARRARAVTPSSAPVQAAEPPPDHTAQSNVASFPAGE